jgi:hypothetical protein
MFIDRASTRVSCYVSPDSTACAAFIKESRMKVINATNLEQETRGIDGS